MSFQQIKPGYIDTTGSSNGQVLTSNGTVAYWAAGGSGGGFSNGQSISVNNFAITGAFTANNSNGSVGQVLTSNGSNVYWSTPESGGAGGYTGSFGYTGSSATSNAVSEYFTTNGSNAQFTLVNPVSTNNAIVSLNGLVLVPDVHYTIDGTTVTLTSVPYASSILEIRNIERGAGVATGYRGSRGDLGYTGSFGFTGSIGYSGSQGIPGEAAAIGYTGSQGDLGYTGSFGGPGYTGSSAEQALIIGVSDEVTPVVVGSSKVTIMTPFDMTLTQIPRAMLSANSNANVVIDIKQSGTSILGANKLSIDANEQTSVTAATQTTLANTSLSNNSILTFDVNEVGSNAKGLKVYMYYVRA